MAEEPQDAASAAQGRYALDSSENYDDYLKAVGTGFATRQMLKTLKPETEITVNGDQWSIKTTSTLKNTEITFTLGKEFDETTIEDRTAKSTVTWADNQLIQQQKGQSGVPDSTITRELNGNQMKEVLTAGDVTCTRFHKKQS